MRLVQSMMQMGTVIASFDIQQQRSQDSTQHVAGC